MHCLFLCAVIISVVPTKDVALYPHLNNAALDKCEMCAEANPLSGVKHIVTVLSHNYPAKLGTLRVNGYVCTSCQVRHSRWGSDHRRLTLQSHGLYEHANIIGFLVTHPQEEGKHGEALIAALKLCDDHVWRALLVWSKHPRGHPDWKILHASIGVTITNYTRGVTDLFYKWLRLQDLFNFNQGTQYLFTCHVNIHTLRT